VWKILLNKAVKC